MKLLLVVAVLLVGTVFADICPGVTTVPGGQCSEIWFGCLQTGTSFLNEVDLEFGEQQTNGISPWTIAKSGWAVKTGLYTPNNIAMFYANGVPTQPMNGGSFNIGQGQWACTKDGQFQAANPQSSNDFGTGSIAVSVDLFRRNGFIGWGLRGIGSRTPGGTACLTDTVSSIPRLNSVPAASPTCNPSTGTLVGTITSQMTLLGSCGSMTCYAASFDPCQCNGCPAGYVRVGPNSDCCPAGAVIVGDGTAGNPTRCCPAGQTALLVPGSTNYICCPTGQVATRAGTCCPAANYVAGNPDACCPFANPACQSGSCTVYQFCATPPCTTRELCCPQANVNKPLGTANPICCPTAATNDGCNFRKRLHASDRFHANCAGTPQWQQTADGTLCCPPARASENNQFCCPTDPPTGQWFVTVGNNNCCPSGQVAANGQYCCPGSATGTVSVPEGDASTVPQCCPSGNVASVGPGNDYCCPSAPPSGQQWCRAAAGASGTNINCCVCTRVSGGTGSSSYCCPADPPSGQTWTQTTGCDAGSPVDCKCCPTNRRNADGSYCCPSAPPSGQTWVPTSGCAAGCGTIQQCCPSSQVVQGYCCPATGGPFTKTNDQQCCPSNLVALPPNGATTTSGLRCCPATGGPFQVTSNQDCCPTNQVSCVGGTASCSQSQSYCCPTAEITGKEFWNLGSGNGAASTNPLCCPADQVSANTVNKYCCPTGSASPQYWDPVNQRCCPAAEWDGTQCCPAGNALQISGCSSATCDRTQFGTSCSTNTPSITCCNTDSTQARCCPAGQRWTGSGCCDAALVPLSNPLTNKLSSVCCPAGTPSGSVLTINNNCCPSSNVGTCGTSPEYCDSGRTASNNRGPICCPASGQLVADTVLFCAWNAGSCPGTTSCNEGSPRCSDISSSPFASASAANYCCPPSNALILDCNSANPTPSQTCSSNIVCCPGAVDQSNTIVARASWNTGVQVCCPAANVIANGALPTSTAQCGYSSYNPSSLTCCPAAVAGTYVWTNNIPCCPAGQALTGTGNTGCPYCCPATSPCIAQGLGCTCLNACFNFNAAPGGGGGANNYADCYPCNVIVNPPGTTPDVLCVGSTYWAQYGYTTGYQYTTNEVCCPTALVTESPPGSGILVCCPSGQVGAPNLAQVGITSGCCPATQAVSIPPAYQNQFNGAVNWCCPPTLTAGACTNCQAGVTANVAPTSTCNNQIFCTSTCTSAWDSATIGFAVRQNVVGQCAGTANNVATWNSGCCPANRLSNTAVCCPDPSWLPSGATWLSGLTTRYDGTWFPNNCCPSTWRQIDQRQASGVGNACCPGSNQYYTNWATTTTLQNCCPDAQRVLPQGYAGLTPTQINALTSSNGVWCCPDPTVSTSVCTTAGPQNLVASTAGGWGWYFGPSASCGGSTNIRCCPLNNLLGPNGPVTTTTPADAFSTRLCCPGDATTFTYITQGGQPLCCPTSGATVNPINTPGQPKCCPAICASGCPANVWWSQTYTPGANPPATGTIGNYDCCPTEPQSATLVRLGITSPSPAALEEVNICCPVVNGQPGRRTGCPSSCASGDQGVTYCCPADRVLNLTAQTGPFDWRNARCCPSTITDPNTKWVRTWAGGANTGTFGCCPSNLQKTWQSVVYCCPNPTDVSTAQTACCPAANVVNDPVAGLQCCPSAVTPGTLWLLPAQPGGQALGSSRVCCPPEWQNADDSACCPVSLFPTCGSGSTTCVNIASNPPNYCCIPTNVNNANTACCPGANRIDTSNDVCCPAAQARTYNFGAGNAGSICCPASVTSPVIVNDNGSPSCCPADRVLNDGGVLRCCPSSLTQNGLTPADWVWVTVEATGQPGCCPKTNLNSAVSAQLPAGTVCCPQTGSVHTTDDECCVDFAVVSTLPAPYNNYVACCPQANSQVVNTVDFADVECCPSVRVVNDGSGVICCPDGRWNEDDQSCCPAGQTAIGSIDGTFVACCPDASLTTDGNVCCLPDWWGGTDVSLDPTGACCPTSVIALTGECCPATEKDYLGVCCPTESQWGLSYDRNGNLQNRSCCINFDADGNNVDCNGFCLPPTGQPVEFYTDANGVCCPYDELDCANFCPLAITVNGTLVLNNTNGPDGKCCPPDARDCLGDCYGYDLNCCSLINNCTGCIASDGCGWCGAPGGGATAHCASGDFFGATGNDGFILPFDDPQACTGETWIYLAKSTIQLQTGRFSQPGDPVVNNLEWTLQRVVLAPNQPLIVPISVRSPENIPLDLFFLQDVTASFENDMSTVNATINQFLDAITDVVADTWFGWGSFRDKPTKPFGEYFVSLPSRQDYVVKIEAMLSPSKSAIATIYDQYAALNLVGGGDIPEASLEAMLAISDITGTVRDVGWRSDINPDGTDRRVNRVALIITDAPPHQDPDIANAIAIPDPNNPSISAFPNLEPLNGWPVNNLDPFQDVGSRDTEPNSADGPQLLPGLGEKYPNMQDVANIWAAAKIFPIFLVAPTDDPDGVYQPTDAKTNFTLMSTMFPNGRAIVTDLSADSSNLQSAVVSALETVTQTISLVQRIVAGSTGSPFIDYTYGIQGILADPNNPPQASPGTILNYTVRLVWDGTPACEAGQTTFCVPQPHTIPFDAIFPIQGTTFENGNVDVIVGQPQTCGFCADRVWQPWLGEQCDPLDPTLVLPDGSPNPCCTITCEWGAGVTCDASNLCAPRVCAADGTCITDDQLINNCDSEIRTSNDPQGLCSTFTCQPFSGECVWACIDGDLTGLPCCDDNNNCTIDYCVNGECQHRLDPACDCASQINCGGCVDMNATCVWDNLLGLCYTDNISITITWMPGPDAPKPSKEQQAEWKAVSERYAWTPDMVQSLCVGKASKPVSAGTIVGAVIGAALAAAACCCLGAALLIVAIVARAQGKTLGNQFGLGYDPQLDVADDNPLYKAVGHGHNPLFGDNQ